MRHTLLLALAPAILAAQSADSTATRVRRDSSATHRLEAVSVSAIRAHAQAPVSSTTLDAAAIARRSFGQDVPLLLQGTPSLTSYAETGNNWGYSYLRLRGIDQSRINITLDGIPLNDPEDQVLYFADFPDLATSISSVQVQRGVGTSAPGTASYGGSINLQTTPVAGAPRGVAAQLQGGSFGSLRGSVEYTTGPGELGVTTHARLSLIQSDGYRRHSGMNGRSVFVSSAWVGDRDIVKFTALGGVFADTLAYVGATRAELAVSADTNILRGDELDRFGERLFALSHARDLGGGASIANTVYRISAAGNYDVCVATCDQVVGDLWKFHLDFVWYGATSVATLTRGRARLTSGVNANTYERDHYAYDSPDFSSQLYSNTGHKRDGSAFTKLEYDVGRSTLFGDLQGRHAVFEYTPDAGAAMPARRIAWSFFNPKAGATVRLSPALTAYASYGVNGREPARSDMFAGFDNITSSDTAFVGPLSRVRPERVRDFEGGLRHRTARWSADLGAFAMAFRNEILPVGQLSYLGLPLRKNVESSWRRGVEFDGAAQPTGRARFGLSATLMRARITEFTDDNDSTTYRDVPPLLTPEFTSTQTAAYDVSRSLSVGATGRWVGESFLNNTANDTLALPSQYMVDVAAHWTRGTTRISLFVNNAGNSRRFASGHVSFGEARYYILPPRNVHLLVRLATP